jgi:uncharacterized membrane protein SirB2
MLTALKNPYILLLIIYILLGTILVKQNRKSKLEMKEIGIP